MSCLWHTFFKFVSKLFILFLKYWDFKFDMVKFFLFLLFFPLNSRSEKASLPYVRSKTNSYFPSNSFTVLYFTYWVVVWFSFFEANLNWRFENETDLEESLDTTTYCYFWEFIGPLWVYVSLSVNVKSKTWPVRAKRGDI